MLETEKNSHYKLTPTVSAPTGTHTSTMQMTLLGIAIPSTGVLLGLLIALLLVTTTGWVYTCWILKKRGRMTTERMNSRQVLQYTSGLNGVL